MTQTSHSANNIGSSSVMALALANAPWSHYTSAIRLPGPKGFADGDDATAPTAAAPFEPGTSLARLLLEPGATADLLLRLAPAVAPDGDVEAGRGGGKGEDGRPWVRRVRTLGPPPPGGVFPDMVPAHAALLIRGRLAPLLAAALDSCADLAGGPTVIDVSSMPLDELLDALEVTTPLEFRRPSKRFHGG